MLAGGNGGVEIARGKIQPLHDGGKGFSLRRQPSTGRIMAAGEMRENGLGAVQNEITVFQDRQAARSRRAARSFSAITRDYVYARVRLPMGSFRRLT